MHPFYEMSYLAEKTRHIPYTDFYTITVKDQAAGNTFSTLLTNGVVGLRKITVFPCATANVAYTGLPTGTQVYHSPFSTALTNGDSGCPFAHIGQFQIQVAGCNVLTQQHRYGYEHWIEQMGCSGANFGLVDGASSGLLSRHAWEMAPVFTCDLSRMTDEERKYPKSVQLMGTNLSTCNMDYICFLEFDQVGLSVDLLTGERV
jgi:hypothetical protein